MGTPAVDGAAAGGWLAPLTGSWGEAIGTHLGLPRHWSDPFGIRLHHLRSPREIARIAHLRDHIDLELHRSLDPRFDEHERRRDTLGVTVAFELQGRLIGTIRAVPMSHGLTLTEKLIASAEGLTHLSTHWSHEWEMGRLVLDPEFRAGSDFLRHCLYLALSYLDRRAKVEGLHASCTPILARLYRRLGFEVVASEVPLAATTKTYTLIHGPFERVLEALSSGEAAVRDARAAFQQRIPVSREVYP